MRYVGTVPGYKGSDPVGSTRNRTLIFPILCSAIDPYRYWYQMGTEAVAHLVLQLVFVISCPKHSVIKPTKLSAGCMTGK